MLKIKSVFINFLHSIIRDGQKIFKIFLLILLLFQLFYLSFSVLNIHFPAPFFIQEKIKSSLEKRGFYYDSKKIMINLLLDVEFEKIKLYEKLNQHLLFEADLLSLEFSLFNFLFGTLPIDKLIISNGSIFFPLIYSSSNKNLDALKNIDTIILFDRHHFSVPFFKILFSDTCFNFQGKISYNVLSSVLKTTLPPTHEDPSSIDNYNNLTFEKKFFWTLNTIRNYFLNFKKSYFRVHFQEEEKKLFCKIAANGLEYNINNQDKILNWNLNGQLQYANQNFRFEPLVFSTSHIFLPSKDLEILNLDSKIIFSPDSTQQYYFKNLSSNIWHEILLSAEKIFFKNMQFESISLDILNTDTKNQILKSNGYFCGGWVNANFSGNLNELDGVLMIEAQMDPRQICLGLSSKINLNWMYDNDIKFTNPPHWVIHIPLQSTLNFNNIPFSFDAENFQFNNSFIDSIKISGNYTSSAIKIDQGVVNLNNEQLNLFGHLNLDSADYRFIIDGYLDPMLISKHFPEWWTKTFTPFQFEKRGLYGNLDISDNYYPGKNFFLCGFLKGYNFEYKDVFSQYAFLNITASTNVVDLNNIYIIDKNDFSGLFDLKLVYKQDLSDPYFTNFKGVSGLSFSYLKIFEDTERLRDLFWFDDIPPILAIDAHLYNKTIPEYYKTFIGIGFKTPLSFYLLDYPIDYADMSIIYTPFSLLCQNVNIGLAKGFGQGNLRITGDIMSKDFDESKNFMDINLNFKGLHKKELLEFIPYLRKIDALVQEISDDKVDSPGGLVDLDIQAKGIYNDLLSYVGDINVHVYDADFGKIRLFGGLGSLLSPLLFGFGSISLDDAKLKINVNNQNLFFNDIRLTGPSAQILMFGNLNMQTDQINFEVEIQPFGNIKTPVFSQIFSATKPISKTLKFKLSGSVQKPYWKFAANPISIF